MRTLRFCLLCLSLCWIGRGGLYAQETFTASVAGVEKISTTVEGKAANLTAKLDKATETYLLKLQKQEEKLRQKLLKKDSLLARQLFAGVEQQYEALKGAPQKLSKYSQLYSGHLDSLTTALNFLKSNGSPANLDKALSGFTSLQQKLDQSEKIKQFLTERKRLLKENLERLGMLKQLKGFGKQAYYYAAQVKEYKQLWEDPSKLEAKLLEVLSQTDAFRSFFAGNSQLASLFALPGSSTTATASLAGLQTRASVQQGIQDRFGAGPQVQQLIQQNLQAAQGQLSELKNKLSQYSTGTYGNSSSDIELPEGFKPNGQKTKTFLQRLEYGANVQSQKSTAYFPTTSDVGLSLGYKLNDNSSIGVGAAYKLGWGRGWNHLRLSSEGVGLRSYIDYKLKGTLYISGGYEQNYRTAFSSIQQLKDLSAWQQSGLLGLSKKYKVSKKVKGEIKLLWDFLSYQQTPKTQAVLFRVGYNLK